MDNNSVSNPLANIGRVHYLDQVRALALMAGILMHACYTYGYVIQDIWYLTDQTSSMGITVAFLFFHLFRMPVFFLIAGFFANYIYQKRGVKGFLKHRLKRIGLPFAIFLPLVLIAVIVLQVFIILYLPVDKMSPSFKAAAPAAKAQIEAAFSKKSRTINTPATDMNTPELPENKSLEPATPADSNLTQNASNPNPEEIHKANASDNPPARQADPQITQHLWFLYYLFLFCLCAALFQKFSHPFITWIFTGIFSSPVYLWLIPLFMVPFLYHVNVPWGGPMHIIPRLWPFGHFGIFFLLGWHFFYHQDYLDKFKNHFWIIFIVSIIGSAYYLYDTPVYFLNSRSGGPANENLMAILSSQKMVLVVLEAYLSVFLTIICLILGKRYLDFSNKYMRLISDSSYWIYIIHFPLVTFIQVFLVTAPFSGYLKLLISSAILFAIGLVTYRYMVRYTFIGTLLNGKKARELER